jgi:hypothetical protein
MCWNERVSWTTFIIGTIFSVIGVSQSTTTIKTWLHLFFQLVIFVQFGEALVWRDIDVNKNQICGNVGKIGSIITFFSVWLQPILGLYILYLLGISQSIQKIYFMLLVVYVISSIENIKNIFKKCYKPVCNEDCKNKNLEFTGWNHSPIMGYMYMITINILLYFMYERYPYVSGYVFVTMILSALFYKNTFGSIWCWFSAFTPLIAIFYTK